MIVAKSTGARRFAAQLVEAARRRGEAGAEARQLQRRDDARRWRLARLLWPLFAKER